MLHRLSWASLAFVAGIIAVSSSAHASSDCATESAFCDVDGGTYAIELPEQGTPLRGALVFLHGWGARAEAVLRNREVVEAVRERGYAFVAPNGTPRRQGQGLSWSFHPDFPQARDEAAFFETVFEDLAARHGVPRDRILLGGFSAGGFMTSYLACAEPQAAAAYVPVSGGFWRPHPERCAGPVRLFHTHGWSDTVVPLEGRFLGGGRVAQGDIFHGMDIWRAANGCSEMRADDFQTDGLFWRRSWTRCHDGAALEFALFPGGHRVPEGWADMILDWFEAEEPS